MCDLDQNCDIGKCLGVEIERSDYIQFLAFNVDFQQQPYAANGPGQHRAKRR